MCIRDRGTLLHKPERQGFRRWLNDSDGSFRGAFYSRETRCASVFTDPYGSRPVYYREKGSECAASDKVASLVNAGASVIDWNAILEAMALGTVVSQETSIEGIVQLPPGHIVALLGNGGTELSNTIYPMWTMTTHQRTLCSRICAVCQDS